MNILVIDTSGPACGVAVAQAGKIVCELQLTSGRTHSQRVMPMVDTALALCELTPADIDVFGAVVGPGSFTGVRIGVSTVKALAQATGKPCLGVDALEALAYGACGFVGTIAPMFDARRSQVYAAAFAGGAEFARLQDDVAAPLDEFVRGLPQGEVLFLGDGADAGRARIAELRPGARFAPAHMNFPRAAAVCALAQAHPERAVDYLALKPLYLRAPQAERERLAKGLKV